MRRRVAVALVLAVGLFADGGAGAQTTSTTSTTSSSTTTSVVILTTTTTSTSTTSTTMVNPCTGQPCTDRPPVATLSGSGGDIRLEPGDFCWRQPVPDAVHGPVTVCTSVTPALDIPVQMVIRRGETLTLRFATTMSPTQVVLQRGDGPGAAPVPLTAANPTTFVADLPVGVYFLNFRTTWNQGDAGYLVKVDVRAPATASDPRILALTG